MQQFLAIVLNGVATGMIYAAFALALVLIWQSTRIVNFAQAPMAMITVLSALWLIDRGVNYWVAFVGALVMGLILGALVERLVIRYVDQKSHINPVILTLGLFIVIHSVAAIIFHNDFRSFPAPLGVSGIAVGDMYIPMTWTDIFAIVIVLVVMGALRTLFLKTDIGLKMRASAFNPEVARLLGVRVSRTLTLGWALAAMVGSLAGLLIASGGLVHPSYMDGVVIFGFVAAVLGGLDSPAGAVVGGLIVGLTLSFVSGYLGSGLVPIAALLVLVAVLLVKPSGLFSTTHERTV
ncbi:MAG: branched-chain amino acid ABC transporter permease [Mobilicoccus sp.]|nr:branched-chain amino acid ABC transporter permease [Mobilicoccus sp.]